MENISAISTSLAPSGVAIIRVSGSDPLNIAKKMFRAFCKTDVENFEPNKMYVGEIDGVGFKDTGLCVYFKAPKSYTGEDMVEFHSHGGVAIAKGVLQKTIELGARLATNGEFTKRAFLNGKMSLSSAEGLIDMINSESVGEVKAGYYLYREKLKVKTEEMQNKLTNALAQIDADIDFPEEDLETFDAPEIKSKLVEVKNDIDVLLKSYKTGRKLKNGVRVSICGKPNTGKSHLLNALLNYDKAIVSSIAGTTRDIVEGEVVINGIKFCFYDTAGIRESDNEIEKIGINLAKKNILESDLVLYVIDASIENDFVDETLLESVKDKNVLIILNKIDKPIINKTKGDLLVSAKTGENIENLKQALYDIAIDSGIDLNGDFLTEERHYNALVRASEKLDLAIINIGIYPLDVVAIDIKDAWEYLGEISGKTASEDIISEIFAKFCVGK